LLAIPGHIKSFSLNSAHYQRDSSVTAVARKGMTAMKDWQNKLNDERLAQ